MRVWVAHSLCELSAIFRQEAYFVKYAASARRLNGALVAAKRASPAKYAHLGLFSPSCYKHEMLPVVEYLAEVTVPVVAGPGVARQDFAEHFHTLGAESGAHTLGSSDQISAPL